jgi:L-alanine-DL-glutamate epimerase-like enolase superfamily enzyme
VPRTPEQALAALPVVVDEVECVVRGVPLASYPGRVRPTSEVRLGEGRGEHVGWTAAAHEAFRERVARVPRGRWARLDAWAAAMRAEFADPYERAALEAAAIDLALRQARTSLFGLLGVAPRPVRYVVSFEKVADPVERVLAEARTVELKIDADPAWDDDIYGGLAALGRVAVLDFKGAGAVAAHERAHRALPRAFIEDPGGRGPWSPSLRRRLSLDAAVTSAAAVDALAVRPAAVNVKPARMGGVLEALACVARCRAARIDLYLGGMFEVGAGRRQLRALAALVAPDAPNDIAPLVDPQRPARLAVDGDAPGFA